MSNYKKSFNRRAFVVYAIALLFGIMCVIQILYLATSQRPMFGGDSKYCLDKTQPGWEKSSLVNDPNCRCVVTISDIAPVRGDILDDQGNILASNFTVFDVTIDGRKLMPETIRTKKEERVNDTLYATKERRVSRSDKEAVNKLIADLTDQFYYHFKNKFPHHDKEYYRKKLSEAVLEHKNVLILKSNPLSQNTIVTSEDTAFIRKLPLFHDKSKKKCVNFTSHYKRINPYGELAKQAIGAFPPERWSGLELMFHDWLAGDTGAQKILYIDGIRVPSEKFSNPRDGATIHTTLSLKMQNIVYEALMDKLYEMNAEWGTVVLMEVKTGEVKAMANLTRHKNERGNTGYFELLNHAFRSGCEPGSTFKLASLLAYLEKTPNDNEKTYLLCGCDIAKHFAKDSKKFRTTCGTADVGLGSRHRQGKPMEIFQRSLNEGTGAMVFDAYKNNYQAYLAALDSMGITMPLETQLGKVDAPQMIRNTNLMRTFYITTWGGFNMAPIQTLTYFNAVANNGKMVCPKIVSYVTEQDKVVEVFPTVVLKEQMAQKDVIERAQKYLEAVVSGPYGTARAYKDSTLLFAGKTGTRDILVKGEDGSYKYENRRRNSIAFCGYFPVENPQYSMIVYLYDVTTMSGPAVQLFYTIAKRIMSEETTTLMNVVDKSGGVKNTKYANMGKR
jgi:cell division protein FtsI/penicillin-binding protein 2